MTEKDRKPLEQETESILDFKDAKEMTIGQANRKAEEIEAGVTEGDNVLDKYIKQHQAEIEAEKYDTKILAKEELAKAEELAASETVAEAVEAPEVTETVLKQRPEMDAISTELPAKIKFGPTPTEPIVEAEDLPEETPSNAGKRIKAVLYSTLGLAIVGSAIFVTYNWMHSRGTSGGTTVVSSSSSKSSSTSKSSSSETQAQKLEEFTKAYDAFFVDESKSSLKNDKFGDLENLKKLLDKLEGSSDYNAARTKYEDLVKQVSAIQKVNSQFSSPVIKDGVLDANAKVKSDATFAETKTGNDKLDSLLNEAVAQGRSQQVATPAPVTGTGGTDTSNATPAQAATPTAPAVNAVTGSAGTASPGYSGYGLPSDGVPLQRNLSRVPYNQVAINDVNNPAWVFGDGILEKVLNIARKRGHITGNQYILERVNIINGNGYYNLFKPDGTYLFSINAKTGYFVGNGKGHSDALDY
ncbi:cell division site-positioning protein MapZ family protein [Streptococcus sp. S1]|uniref:Mid-cell-anchored protein Z n=1 Tax=Streptococcus dentalis TaxID=3098075 RepID=A0ABZ0T3I4_9STRE|nr:cell division site-positioning protein MapZ family protein [Streptococcus sp. S1]WPS53890.1 cell division site-positioning protein MapZ family protein [Streptococcus sp. S1]